MTESEIVACQVDGGLSRLDLVQNTDEDERLFVQFEGWSSATIILEEKMSN